MKLNLPNRLTIIRIIMVPAVMVFIALDFGLGALWSRVIAALLFIIASATDALDGRIARKYNLITNFGKLMDPLADKMLVIGSLVALCTVEGNTVYGRFLLLGTAIVIFRELAVTSMRLVVAASPDKIVIAANKLGKIKTCTQVLFILAAILERALWDGYAVSYITMTLMAIMTLWSGFEYFKSYWKYINPSN